MKLKQISLSLAAIASISSTLYADEAPIKDEKPEAVIASSLEEAFSKGAIEGQIRGLYMNQINTVNNGTPNNNTSAFAIGGNLGFTTAPYYGISAGAKFYTTQVLASSANFNGGGTGNAPQSSLAGFFENTQGSGTTPQSYSVLGQAFLQGTYAKTTVKVGRQDLDTPLAGGDDGYMIPNLFQAGVIANKDIPDTTVIGAYINGMMGGTNGDSHSNVNAQTAFSSMSRSALGSVVDNSSTGSSIGNQPVWALGLVNETIPFTTAQAWYYNNTNVLQAFYVGLDSGIPISGDDWKINAGAQYYNLNNQGTTKNLLTQLGNSGAITGNTLNYGATGVKLGLDTPIGLTPEVAATFIGGKTGTVYVFNAWGGVPNYTDMAYVNTSNFVGYAGAAGASAKGSNQWKYSLTQDLGKLGLGERSLSVAYGVYDFAKSNNNGANFDTAVWDVTYSCKNALIKNLELQAYYENISFRDNTVWANTSNANMKTNNIIYLRAAYNF